MRGHTSKNILYTHGIVKRTFDVLHIFMISSVCIDGNVEKRESLHNVVGNV